MNFLISLQLSMLHPSCRRVFGGGRRFINRFDLITRLRRRGTVYGVYLLIERLVEGLAVIGIVTALVTVWTKCNGIPRSVWAFVRQELDVVNLEVRFTSGLSFET